VAATIFAVHTANTETLNLISARSKVHAVMYGPLLFVYSWLWSPADRPREKRRDALRASWPALAASAAVYAFVRRMDTPEWTGGTGALAYAWTQPFVWLHYARLFFLPIGLTAARLSHGGGHELPAGVGDRSRVRTSAQQPRADADAALTGAAPTYNAAVPVLRKPSLVDSAAFLLVLAGTLTYVAAHVPPAGGYQMGADEGMYYRQATAIAQAGPRAFAALGNIYVSNEALQSEPAPLRIGHLVAAALVLRVNPSVASLSALSLACYVLLCVAVFLFAGALWDGRTAAVAGIFAAVSPLGWGLAMRALMDTDHALFSILSLFMFIVWLSTGRERHFIVFAVVLWWCLLVKETAWVYVPFAAAAMVILKLAGRDGIHARHILIVAVAIPAAVGAVYALAFGGIGRALAVIETAQRANVARPNDYLVATGSGPWYEYLVDFVLLSPPVAILFLMFCGRFAAARRRDLAMVIVLLFICYAIACLSLVPKNPRFALPLDPLLRLCAASMVVATAAELRLRPRARTLILAAFVLLVAVSDARAFRHYFVIHGIYDPVAVNLLAAEKFLPAQSR
jgi:hypothetical protein